MTTAVHTLEGSGLGRALRESLMAYPRVETLQSIGLRIDHGSIVIVGLRLLGLSRRVSVVRPARHAFSCTVRRRRCRCGPK